MLALVKELCKNPAFHAIMYGVIFAILGYLFKCKISKEVHDTEMKSIIQHLEDQKIDLARLERRMWDLATGNEQMPLDPAVVKKSNDKKNGEEL
jgi:hypothetical protein